MGSGTYDARWRKVRESVLERDGGECQIRGPKCTVVATEGDHIVPVDAGGPRLDENNVRASCKPCNAGRASRTKAEEGWRRSSTRIVLVVGPPAAGKSTFVAERADPEHLVVDYDLLAQALGSASSHGHGAGAHEVTMAARNAVLRKVRRGELEASTVWIVSSNPRAEQFLPHHEVVVVDPGRDVVLDQVRDAGRPMQWVALVDDWYRARQSDGLPGPSREW